MTLPAEEKDVSSTLIDTEVKACEEVVEADCPTVLVIDDNADIRNYVKSLLTQEFRVLDAADGTEGIRLAMKYVPDVTSNNALMSLRALCTALCWNHSPMR